MSVSSDVAGVVYHVRLAPLGHDTESGRDGEYGDRGLPTLVVARKKVGKEIYMELLGLTGVDDRLQDEVRSTLELMRNAEVKVWMLTGDKVSDIQPIPSTDMLKLRNQQKYIQTAILTSDPLSAVFHMNKPRHTNDQWKQRLALWDQTDNLFTIKTNNSMIDISGFADRNLRCQHTCTKTNKNKDDLHP
ncbi:hypothetical protein F5877DRAFT_71833 [Lentinula edodes]|nr:hypothetical protein F5877DRAFT_71833 [Lentinula edodes]